MSTTCECGAEWTGLRIEHCTACHETFSGTSAGDKHRTGDHAIELGPFRRRCLTTVEMTGKGMVRNARGVWTLGGANPWARPGQDGSGAVPEGDCPEVGVQAVTAAYSDSGREAL